MAGGTIDLLDVERQAEAAGRERLTLVTDRGRIDCRLHAADDGDAAILWVFGTGGGLGGPAGGLYTRLGERLRPLGVTSLELAYRRPGVLFECVADALVGVAWLTQLAGRKRLVLVGHSFGGAVVITAGAASEAVVAVAALSSQSNGTGNEISSCWRRRACSASGWPEWMTMRASPSNAGTKNGNPMMWSQCR